MEKKLYIEQMVNPALGIGTFAASNADQNRFLIENTKYIAEFVNAQTIRLYFLKMISKQESIQLDLPLLLILVFIDLEHLMVKRL